MQSVFRICGFRAIRARGSRRGAYKPVGFVAAGVRFGLTGRGRTRTEAGVAEEVVGEIGAWLDNGGGGCLPRAPLQGGLAGLGLRLAEAKRLTAAPSGVSSGRVPPNSV